jgi:protocatechuate 3,4-dioxygenase, alpha subunit
VIELGLTPSQTVGPFYAIGLPWPDGPFAVAEGTPGAVWLRGTVYDGAGEPIPDALIETWQSGTADGHDGRRRGFARCGTESGGYAVLFLKPSPVPGPDGSTQAPHLAMSVFARGLLDRVVTRVYFDDEPDANAADPILASVAGAERRATLISVRSDDGYRFDIRLQGEGETVFFDV